ncbi:MAG: S-layer protein [Gimesia sp.]|nr:S-layer protein [Gimesia sp.]
MFGLLYEQNSITRSYQLIWMIVCLLVSGQSMLDAAEKMPLADDSAKRKVYFTTDVVPLLTRLNCNSGGCHGKSTGQNGFKISLLGFDPAMDYSAIARESRGRRIFPGDPDRSLLLLKATGLVPHGGGRLLEADSADYALLYDWIEQGAIGPHPDDPKINKIELSPGNRVFQQRSSLQLRVTAYFSDGTQRDVTHQSIYESNYPEIGKVDQEGLITTQSRGGVFAVMARFGEKIAVFQGVVPYHSKGQQKLTGYPSEEQLSKIDQRLVAQWKKLGILPSKPVDDATFIRRVTLDICGTLPTVDEVRQYLADSRADKRERLIDRLLERPEYASYFALKWADILQNRGSGYGTRNQRAGTMLFSAWIRDSIVANKPYDRFVTELLTATGRQAQNPPAIWYRSVRSTPDYVESVAQAFLGVRVQCAQCHHHPSERWSEDDYYSFAAIFSRVGRKEGFADAEVPTNEVIYLKDEGEVHNPRSGKLMQPRPLGGPDFKVSRFDDPRRNLAKWMTSPENPFFARTMVNRMWGHFFGRGIIHPIDDARSTNPPTNPVLLDELAYDFAANGYDMKQLIREITNSYAYRLSANPNETNAEDSQCFARYYPKRLSAEVLLDGISQVLDVPTVFPGGPGVFPEGMRAVNLPDENVRFNFLDVFGRPARTSACECERTVDPALSQALELVNSKEIQRKLTDKNGYVEQLATNQKTHSDNVHEIFVRTLSRPPSTSEVETAVKYLNSEKNRHEAYRSLVWALLATNEFMMNH